MRLAGRRPALLGRLARAALALASCGAAGACSADDVVVMTLPTAASSETTGECTTNDDCPPTAFCARQTCADPFGTCEIPDPVCDEMVTPTCGCDGVSYWNDCLRQRFGVTASIPGSCTIEAAACMDPTGADCPVYGAACAKLVGRPDAPCDDQTIGACWVLPATCPQEGFQDRWSSCTGGPMDCLDTCSAILTGGPFHHDFGRECQFGPSGGPPGGR